MPVACGTWALLEHSQTVGVMYFGFIVYKMIAIYIKCIHMK